MNDSKAMNAHLNIPNILTSIRLLLSPVIALLFIYDSPVTRFVVLGMVCISELTDLFDGYMARKRGEVTDLGKILDPLADSIYRDTMFLSLAYVHQVSLMLVLPILYRDSIIATLRTVCAYRGIVLAARWSGKIKAVVQAVVIILILVLRIVAVFVTPLAEYMYLISNILLSVATVVTLYSAFDYISGLLPQLIGEPEQSNTP
ncbi:MAG: CDP-diacylglycerol--glycerol-3-phosphate 3-phosphatidyltransferase [bacterium]|jgi:CDP-diacylglycerol--glycerol-3-phosphate 3-phosphatidyltransferase|nr:CDP-diacylglycerol--glycerol-3-phosphate 3-phosphatidyltransferase [bacterium]